MYLRRLKARVSELSYNSGHSSTDCKRPHKPSAFEIGHVLADIAIGCVHSFLCSQIHFQSEIAYPALSWVELMI